jgi:hypothetical protein
MRHLVCLVLLAACNAPSPHFTDVPPKRLVVDGSTFDVRVKRPLAEAVRVNPEYAPRFGPIRARAAFAMARVSGCKVVEVTGDQALALGKLECPDGPPMPVFVGPTNYSCVETPRIFDVDYIEFDCDPVRY